MIPIWKTQISKQCFRGFNLKKGKRINLFTNFGDFDLKAEKTCTIFIVENKGLLSLTNNSSFGTKNIAVEETDKFVFSK